MAKRAARFSPAADLPDRHSVKSKPYNVSPLKKWDPLHSNGNAQPVGGTGIRYVKNVKPQSPGQAALWQALHAHHLSVAIGPAGSGKTYLAIAAAVEALEAGTVDRVILCRPAVEAGESLGYLPGDIAEKMAPFLRPLTDALIDRVGAKRLKQYLADGTIEIAPVAYMRGRTLNKAFIVIDEAQNCTYAQIKMLLTRLGFGATMVLTGDPGQTDLLDGLSGLAEIARKLSVMPGIGVVQLHAQDIVRHPLVAAMLGVL